MSISFSGLASGLDTSSWVESLVALKKAKVTTLEEEKKEVQSLQETLSQIKSFFSSFRSMLEKVTDAKFGVASMDLFAQNLATSSNLEALTASATTEAEEATYNVLVDKLASETKANSNYSYMTTIVQTTTATGDSKLINLGVKAGNIGVKVNGVEHGISITENDTLSTFIEKLKNIGVNASYNEDSGIFSIDVGKDDINDIDNTGIKDALHLNGVNEGYQSNNLETSKTDTIFSAATESTKLSELNVKAGVVTITANGENTSITIFDTTTLGDFIKALNDNNIEATLDKDGIFTISDAEITNEGNTDIKNALGLDSSIYGKSQTTSVLQHKTTITQTTTATSATLLKDLEGGKDIKDGDTVIVKDSNNESKTITITNASEATLGTLIEELENAGLYAAIKNDGTVEITGGTITGGTLDVEKLLGLQKEPYTAIVTGKPLTETVETHKIVDLQTKLVDDLKVKEGYLEVTDADGNKYYEKIYSGQTIADFMTDMGNLGINTKLDETTGILTITGGAFKTLSDADVQALVASATIVEPDSRYHHGTNLLSCLYGADTISTDQITVASTYSKTKALRHTVTNTINATKNTTLEKLGLSADGTAIFDVRGESRTINLTQTMTISDLMNQLKDAGIGSSFDEDTSRLTIENATITGGTSNLADILDLTTTISGKYVTSDELYTSDTIIIDATRDTLLKDYGISSTMSEAERTVTIYNSAGTVAATTVVGEGTTIGNLIDFINEQNGISANLKDGFLTIHNGYIENAALETAMGLSTSNKNSYALGSIMTVTTTAAVTGETTLSSIFGTIGTLDLVKDGYNLKFNDKDISVSASTTLNELINAIYENGGTASLDHTGRLSVEGGTLTGSVAQALGITSYTHTSSVSATGEKLYVTDNVYANRDTTLKDLGVTGQTSYTIYNSLGQATTTINLENTATIGDFLDGLKANGIDGIIANGVIKLDSAEGSYIQGELATTLGLATQTVTEVVSTTQMSTAQVKHTATLNADLKTTMGELGVVAPDNVFDIYDKNDNLLASFTITDDSTTIEDFFNNLKAYDIVGSINNGVISLYSPNGNYVSGTLADKLGIATEAGENRTMTVGTTVTSTIAVTYTQDVKATEDSLISDYIATFPQDTTTVVDGVTTPILGTLSSTIVDKNGTVLGTINVDKTTTFGELFRELGEYGIDADLHDGVIKLTSPNGNIIQGALATELGLNTETIVTTKTVGASIMSTAAVTYTSTLAATGTTRLDSILGYKIDGTITASGVTGTVIGISTAQDLVNLSKLVNSGKSMTGKTFVLTDDIDMSGISNWTPIGDKYWFCGNFDGQGHTISNIDLTNAKTDRRGVSLFGIIYRNTIQNITLDNVVCENTSTSASSSQRGISFIADVANGSTISNVNVKNASISNLHCNGLVGATDGDVTIENSSVAYTWRGDTSKGNAWQVSGILGAANSGSVVNISGCSVDIDASGTIFLGSGIVGFQGQSGNTTLNISNCYVTGSITSDRASSYNTALSGIVGAYSEKENAYSNINISHCYVDVALNAAQGFVNRIGGGNFVNAGISSYIAVNANNVLYNDEKSCSVVNGYSGIYGVGSYQTTGNYNPIDSMYSFNGYAYSSSSCTMDELGFNFSVWDTTSKTLNPTTDYTLDIKDSNNEIVNRIDFTGKTLDDVVKTLSAYGSCTISDDGVLTFIGDNGYYIEGALANKLGISKTVTGTTTTTVGNTMTSTVAITYTATNTATMTSKLGDVVNSIFVDGTISDTGVTGSVIAISTAQDLINLANLSRMSSGISSGKTFVLTDDIDMSGVTDWSGIRGFEGTFDGQGHTISNLNITNSDGFAGLFRDIRGGSVKDLCLSDFNFQIGQLEVTTEFAGALAALASGNANISNVNVKNVYIVKNGTQVNGTYIGGLIGQATDTTISNCATSGVITGEYAGYAGGLCGGLCENSEITRSNSYAYMKNTSSSSSGGCVAGGIAGFVGLSTAGVQATISDCLFNGTLYAFAKGSFVGNVLTYNGDIDVTFNLNNCISNECDSNGFVYAAYKGITNTEGNSNTTINLTNCFGVQNDNTIVGYPQDAQINNNGSKIGNYTSEEIKSFAKAASYDQTIWDIENLEVRGTSSSPYALEVFDKNGVTLLNTTLGADSTIQDLVSVLKPYGEVSLSDGILSFGGKDGAVLVGRLPESLGVKTTTSRSTVTVGQTITSTAAIIYTKTVAASISTRLDAIAGYTIDGTITASGVTGTIIGISTAQDLVNLAALSKSNDFSGKTFVLTDDINMSSVTNWQMIGGESSSYWFSGNFDGQGHTISGLTMTADARGTEDGAYCGLFYKTASRSNIKNLKLSDFNFTLYNDEGYVMEAGALVVSGNGLIDNVVVENYTANVTGTDALIGGLISYAWGENTITNCSSSGSISGSFTGYASGIAGAVGCSYGSKLSGLQSSMDFNIDGTGNNVGGIVGYYACDTRSGRSTISDCYYNGNVYKSYNSSGIIAQVINYNTNYNYTLNVSNCVASEGVNNQPLDSAILRSAYNINTIQDIKTVSINIANCYSDTGAELVKNSTDSVNINIKNSYSELDGANKSKVVKTFNPAIWDTQNLTMRNVSANPYNIYLVDANGTELLNTNLRASSTIQDVINLLQPYGSVSFNDGVLSFNGNNGVLLGGSLAETFGVTIEANGTTNYYNTSGKTTEITQTGIASTTDVTFEELGFWWDEDEIVIGNASSWSIATITVTESSTLDDFFTQLAAYDIQCSLDSSGKVSFTPVGDYYITGSTFGVLADTLHMRLQAAHTVKKTTTYDNTTSSLLQTHTQATIKTNTTMGEMGQSSGQFVVNDGHGNLNTISIDSTTTVDDIFTQLAAFDILGTIDSDGKVTFESKGDAYLSDISGGFDSIFKINGRSCITSVKTKYANTDSDTFKEEKTSTITSDTTLGELGLATTAIYVASSDLKLVLDENGNVDIDATNDANDGDWLTFLSWQPFYKDNTLGDIFTWLAAHNVSATIYGGSVFINDLNGLLGRENVEEYSYLIANNATTDFLSRLNLSTTQADYITTKTSTTLANTTSDELTAQLTKTMKTSTTLGDLGASGTLSVSFTQDGQDVTLTFNSDDTVDDMLTALAGYGISGQVVNGKLSLTGSKHTFITSISDDLKSALQLGENISYSTVITEGTTVNTDSNKQTYEDANAKITGDTVLSSIEGFQNGNGSLIVHKTDGTFITISVDASKTLDEFFEQISRYGIIGSVDSQGAVTITGVGNAYLQQDTNGSNILTALKLSNVAVNVKTVTVNRTSDTLSHIATVAAKGTTTLENLQDKTGQSINFDSLGKAGLILHAYSDAGNKFATIEFSKTDTIYDIIDKLAEYGIDARLDADGRFSVTSSTLTDFDLLGDIGTFLMGAYTKNYGEDTTHNVSTLLVDRTITQMTDASKLADFGITGGDIRVIQDGKSYTVNVDMTKIKTIGDFRGLLAQYGFNSYIDDAGRLNVIGIGDSTLEQIDGGSNILDRLGLLDWTKGEITQTSTYLADNSEVIRKISMSDKLKDLTNSAGVNLGITAGQIYVYQDGTRSALNIDINDTLETLAAKLSQYGISVGISQDGKLYFDGNNNSYLTTNGLITANSSNILEKFNISDNWSTRYDSTSKNLSYTEDENTKVNGSTKLKDLKDTNGNNLGITTGSFYVYNSGVRNTETITEDTTIDDLKATLAKYGLIADFDENGAMSVGAYNNTYLATSALSGDNSNIVNTLFEQWNFVNIYTSNNLDIPTDEIRAITRDTKLADINEGKYQEGFITVTKDGVKTNISLTADDTVGTLMDELALYGFESVINDKGQLMIKNTGDSMLQAYTGAEQASNALELLGIDINNWINTNTYDSKTLDVTQTTTSDVAATRDTLLSELGVSTGEYYIYNNGVKYTAMISSDETLGSFMDTLKSFGIETSLVTSQDGASATLKIVGKGDSYIKKSTSTTNSSNVVEKLFKDGTSETTLEYKGLEQTSTTTVTTDAITEDTLVSYFDKPWGNDTLKSAGTLAVVVNGQTNTINIAADETFGSLLEKFRALGLEATLSKDGQIMIQSGYDTMTIKSDGTTTSNLLTNISLNYKDDLGGYSASSVTVNSTTTSIEEKTLSVANYASGSTKMDMLNITDGSLTVYDEGRKATIEIKANETFDQLRTRLATAFADLDLTFENGYLKIYSKDGKNVEVGSTTDKGNFGAITGIASDGNGASVSSRELYCVNGDTAITTSGVFRRGNVTEGTFTIGNAVFNIDSTTTLSNLISQINSSEAANATAFWDNVDGKFVIKSRTTGAALVNIEAGTSNFTDILGFTTTSTVDTTDKDGNATKKQVSKMNINTQEIGDNAKVKINGTTYTSTSNNIGSDVTRIKGLTINLKGLTKDSAVTLKVERDKETLANAVSGVVDSYNELMKNVDEAIASDGDLKNESTLKLIRNQLRNLMTSSDSGTTVFRNLDSIGIGVAAASGSNISTTNSAIVSMTFDKDKFLKAYEADQDAVKDLIIGGANNKGIFTKVEDLVESTLKSVSGYFASTETSYSNKIKDLDKKITKANKEVDRYKARLESKFQSMDMLIAQMQQQYSLFLTT